LGQQTIKDVQKRILEIMLFIDELCHMNNIDYYIMGGTALGAVRHGGFIPWDDDLDIFMSPSDYRRFKEVLKKSNNNMFELQEWKVVENYLEYAKVRMNGTTFIEEVYKDRKDIHHGIYVDIMILHKCPDNKLIQKGLYYSSKYVTLVGLSQRNWKPKTTLQKITLYALKVFPNKIFANLCYKFIYSYEKMEKGYKYCYFITKANFKQGIFNSHIFGEPKSIKFENVKLKGPSNIEDYLVTRFGNYMKLPSEAEQLASIHAEIYDTENGFEKYMNF
jgi:lipopolysaccharide cholinephosphotransferase